MPSRIPAGEANDKFVYNERNLLPSYNIFNELTPKRLSIILRDAEQTGNIGPLFEVYDKMLTNDTHYSGLIGQVERAVASLPLKIIPARGTTPQEDELAKDYALMMEEVLAQLDTHSLTKQFIDPFHLGVRLYQKRWEMMDYSYRRKIWMPVEIDTVDGKYLSMERDRENPNYGKLKLRTRRNPKGEYVHNFDPTSFILLRDRDAVSNYHKIGIARKCLPWFLGIQFVRSWWIQYIEGYGAPLRIGKYPSSASESAKANMERFLRVLGQHGYALFPSEMEVQLIEAQRHGSITTYQDFQRFAKQEMTIHVLGQGDTVADNRNGSFARTKETNSIRFETLRDVATITGKGYRELTDSVLGVNYGSSYIKRLRPTIQPLVIIPGDMKTKAETANALQEKGVAVPEEFYYDQVLGTSPREGERAYKYGQVYVFGVDPEPQSMEEKTLEQNAKNANGENSNQSNSRPKTANSNSASKDSGANGK